MAPEMRPTRITPLICLIPLLMLGPVSTARYAANWTSLDARPLPRWFDEAKIGIFVHWGVFSVPGFGQFSEWFWYWWQSKKRAEEVEFMQKNYPPGFKYTDFASEFRAEFFDPDNWADIFKASGARYAHYSLPTIKRFPPIGITMCTNLLCWCLRWFCCLCVCSATLQVSCACLQEVLFRA